MRSNSNTQSENATNQDNQLTIKGMVCLVRFHAINTGYSVINIKVEHDGKETTVTGISDELIPGDCIECKGIYIATKKYGIQFNAESISRALPDNKENMLIYLQSGMVKGIGKKTAERLIKMFGKDVVWVLDNDPGCLKGMRGIGKKTYTKITESWKRQRGIMELIHELYAMGMPTSVAIRIQKKYKEKSMKVIKETPYLMLKDIHGLDFDFVDRIAMKSGLSPVSISRIEAGMGAVLRKESLNGHTYMLEGDFFKSTQRLLKISSEKIIDVMDIAVISGVVATGCLKSFGLETEESFVALPHLHDAEADIVKHIKRLLNKDCSFNIKKIKMMIKEEQKIAQINLTKKQETAALDALTSQVFILHGGPGTGKTTLTRIITGVMRKMGLNISLASPTGRASRRLAEVTEMEASTIHRTLRYQPESGKFAFNEDEKMPFDAFLLDEITMVGVELMRDFLKAIKDGCQLILVGDRDQLMSIGAGAVFRDLIEAKVIKTGYLKKIHRQAARSYIVRNSALINQGLFPTDHPGKNKETDFYIFSIMTGKEDIHKTAIDVITSRIPKKFGYNPLSSIQVITPTNKKTNGVFNLNKKMQEILNPKSVTNCPPQWLRPFRIKDKVIQTSNNYDLDIYNGDIGTVLRINQQEDEMIVDFYGKEVTYSTDNINEVMLAYAITIHKSQGSEYPVTVIVLDEETPVMLQRSLLYTAITRTKELCVVVGSPIAIQKAVLNDLASKRRTALALMLKSKISTYQAA